MNKRFIGVLIFASIVSLGFSTVFYSLAGPPVRDHQSSRDHGANCAGRARSGSGFEFCATTTSSWRIGPAPSPRGRPLRPQDLVGPRRHLCRSTPRAGDRLATRAQGRGRRPGGHDSSRHARGGGAGERSGGGVGILWCRGCGSTVLISGKLPGGNGNLGTLTKTLLQEHRGAFSGPGL